MSTDFLRVNQILTETYGLPKNMEFVFPMETLYVVNNVAKDFTGQSWLSVHNMLSLVWQDRVARGDIFLRSLEDPPQFTPRKFYKHRRNDAPPRLSEFFAEMMVESSDEVKVPSTEGWEDLV